MRILVAGGAGFVGSHVSDRLLELGHDVFCVDNFLTGRWENVAHLVSRPRFRLIETDVTDAPDLDVDVVLHLASPASPVDYDRLPLETLGANSLGTWRLLEIAERAGAHLTYASTSEIYGDPLVHPQPETYWGNVDPIGPRSCYDEGKRFGEALVTSMRRARGVSATIIRIFNTYGPRMRANDGRVMPEMISSALDGRPITVHGGGHQTRSFMYVDDLVAGILAVGLDPAADGEVFNIGNPEEITIRQLAERIRDLTAADVAIVDTEAKPGDPQRRRPEIAHIAERYGWHPTVPLADGLGRTVEWFRAHRTAELAPVIRAPFAVEEPRLAPAIVPTQEIA